jgi:epoxyqueuosine reductase
LCGELSLTAQAFNRKFTSSPVKRAKRRGYLRNVCVALGNRRDPADLPALITCLREEPEALVRRHAAWAIGRFSEAEADQALRQALPGEKDPEVKAEIAAALH